MKENIIDEIFDILHSASWVDYIEYIELTPYVGTQYGTIPIYSNTLEVDKKNSCKAKSSPKIMSLVSFMIV